MINLDGSNLSLESIRRIALLNEKVGLSPKAVEQIQKSHQILNELVNKNEPIYGINTGFGLFAETKIDPGNSAKLSRNLILSHAVSVGENFPPEVVRAAMLIRANTLAKGYSGVRLEVVDILLQMLNSGVTPIVPSQGSLGSSGDLCHLCQMALVFTTDEKDSEDDSGTALYCGEILSGKSAMEKAGIQRIVLGAKEGLAISNGATFAAALASLTLIKCENLFRVAINALGLTLEALMGRSDAFDLRLHRVRGQEGQTQVAGLLLKIIQDSTLINRAGRVQDAYSLRCSPQVMGAVKDILDFCKKIIVKEINAATDNPLLFDTVEAISGGNFHGEPVGLAMDYLGIALSELAAISERRTFRLVDGKLNGGLPSMLADTERDAGLNSGLMMPQYTAASLVLENQTLAGPDSIHSLPTSGEQEDHNANATTAARHAYRIVENTTRVIAIELYTAARAMDLRLRQFPDARMGKGTQKIYSKIRKKVPYKKGDAWWGPEIEEVYKMIINNELQ
jgi:histidine ammonia-lyase